MVQPTQYEEHPFAQYVRILGKGKNGTRAFTEEEAFDSMSMILAGQVEPVQLGAYMMLMRVKEETREELVGFIRAARNSIQIPANAPKVELDWSSYAGKKRVLPWYLLTTLLLAQNGITTFMHGASGHTAGRIYTKDVLKALGIAPCTSIEEACDRMSTEHFAYLDIQYLCPVMYEIIELRPLMGLRSPLHTVARSINPFNAPYVMQGIFHPGYRPVHQEAALLLGEANVAVIKGEGGEIERNPDIACLVQRVRHGQLEEEEWPPMFPRRHVREDHLDVNRLTQVWSGEAQDEYGEAAVIGTAAITLHLMGRAATPKAATELATQLWNARNRDKLGAAA